MTKGHPYPCSMCGGKMITEACGCMTCGTCCHVSAVRCAASDEVIAALEPEPEPLAVVEDFLMRQPHGEWSLHRYFDGDRFLGNRIPVTVTITERV